MTIVNNKRKVLSLLVLALLCCTLLIGCGSNDNGGGIIGGGDKGVSEIFIQKTNMPRLNYVQGQELDLDGGVLTVVVDGEANPVPMNNNADVQVTGYDPNKLGKQTLTVTYKGHTTTFEVNVQALITAEGFETNDFIGDAYDNSKGKLKVLNDKGGYDSVNLNSEEVTLKSFDSSVAGKATVTVTYKDKDCSFEVTVHDVDSIQLTKPKKVKYVSHETEVSVAGGYLTVKAASPSNFSRYIPMTADMVSGFDPSQMTYENRDQVLKQTITVTYGGKQATYQIEIAYSNVHLTQYLAQQLRHLDWEQEEMPEMTEAEIASAMAAIEVYMGLTPAEKDIIDEHTRNYILFAGTMALRNSYLKELESFADAFVIRADGYLGLTCVSYEATATAAARLADSNDPVNVQAALLLQIGNEFGDIAFRGSQLKNFILAISEEVAADLVDRFTYMMDLYDQVKDIPADWTVETLQMAEHEMGIANVLSKIIIGKYQGLSYNNMYLMVSNWRENNDFLEILYTYQAYIKVGGMDELKNGYWQVLPLPGLMNDWYISFMNAVDQERYMMSYETTQAYLHATEQFMYYYFNTLDYAEQIKQCDNQLYKNLYNLLDCDSLIETNLRCGPRGYLYHMNAGLDSAKVMEAWQKIMVIMEPYFSGQQFLFAEKEAEFCAVMDVLVEMSPADLYAFICSINFLYDSSRGTVLVLDTTTGLYNHTMYLMVNFYYNMLPQQTVFPCYQQLMVAMENYSLLNIRSTAKEDFKAAMEAIMASYETMSAEDKAIFDKYLGAGYSKYLGIYSRMSDGKPVDLGEMEAKMDALLVAMQKFDAAIGVALNSETSAQDKTLAMAVVFSTYEKAKLMHSELVAAGGVVADELYTRIYTVEGIELTLESYFSAVRSLMIKYMLAAGIGTNAEDTRMLWDVYSQSAVGPVLAQMADLLVAKWENRVYTGTDLDKIMLAFRSLSPADKNTFFILGVNQLYYAALESYFYNMDASLTEFVPSLLRAEINYAVYQNDQTAENRAAFMEEFAKTLAAFEKLENKDQMDANLRQMYELYKEAYIKMVG